MSFDLIVAGVGGQGSILVSHIIAEAAMWGDKCTRVRVGETFGAAMRGGAVASHVRMGDDVHGPLVREGGADVILALEPLEGLRVALRYMKRGGVAILSTRPWYPVDVSIGLAKYPESHEIEEAFRELGAAVYMIDATRIALEAGSDKCMNVVLLGALSALGTLPVDDESLLHTIEARVPRKAVDANVRAYMLGRDAMAELLAVSKSGTAVPVGGNAG